MFKKACASKNTFWNRQRVAQDMQIKDVAELMGLGISTVGAHFSGQFVPNEKYIEGYCELFGVDILEGTREFINAHKEWDTSRGKKPRISLRATDNSVVDEVDEAVNPAPENNPDAVWDTLTKMAKLPKMKNKILELVYGVVPMPVFLEYYNASTTSINAKEYFYNKVDYDLYEKIRTIINNEEEE